LINSNASSKSACGFNYGKRKGLKIGLINSNASSKSACGFNYGKRKGLKIGLIPISMEDPPVLTGEPHGCAASSIMTDPNRIAPIQEALRLSCLLTPFFFLVGRTPSIVAKKESPKKTFPCHE
jgi:hypothetical protein